MTLFILAETPAGYAILKSKDKKLLTRNDLENAQTIASELKLKKFVKFESAATALEEVSNLVEGRVSPMLAKLLESIKDEKKMSLAVADPKLGTAISKLPGLDLKLISDSSTQDLYRAIRGNLESLIPGLMPNDINTMSLGLSHSLSRHKLKFSPDKIDTMIIQAIALLDDLDKELNTYAMRVKEWMGWHFPEMAKIINDNLAYARVVMKMGMRRNAHDTDMSEILPEEIEAAIKAAAEISMGSDITEEDLSSIQSLAEQVVEFTEYRQNLSAYLTTRMQAIAPNLTTLVGELVGARLIAHSGSLLQLAKSPASTIQILGAEKALFRALKTKHDTPKYGLIYHASLVGQATGKNKGKIARMLATKTALGLRVDSLADWGAEGEGARPEPTDEEKTALGVENRIKIERRLRALEGKPLGPRSGVAIGPGGQTQPGKWELKEARKYNPDADGLAKDAPAAAGAAAPITNGTHTNGNATNGVGGKTPALIEEMDEDASNSDEEMAETNGTAKPKAESRREKDAEKAAKAARKAERAAKREAKALKKAAKELKQTTNGAVEKKRKRESLDQAPEKKKKKA